MNTYVYKSAMGYVMIDTGYENSLKSVEKKLKRRGIDISEFPNGSLRDLIRLLNL